MGQLKVYAPTDKCTNCKKEVGGKVELVPGVAGFLCRMCNGQFEADVIAVCKSYAFQADASAPERYDELKPSLL